MTSKTKFAKEHLEGLAESRTHLLQSFIDAAPQAMVAVDLEWNVTHWNRAATNLFGWSAREVVGKPVPFIPLELQPTVRRDLKALLSAPAPEPAEVIRMHKDGSQLKLLLSVGCFEDRDHAAGGYLGIFTDLTERQRLEEQLRQSQKMQAMGRLAGGVAHDFNNLLTVITACTELLLSDVHDPEQREQLDLIAGAATRATSLTRQLLTFTRQQVVQLQSLDVGDVVRALEPMLRRLLPVNIHLTTSLPYDVSFVEADKSQLEQVLMNLVVNAAEAMPDGGALDVRLSRAQLSGAVAEQHGLTPGRYNRLTVRDSGVGIGEDTIARIFEPFFTTKEIGKGTGLGLATTYGIVNSLRGAIAVDSLRGSGTTFEVYLPESDASTVIAMEHVELEEGAAGETTPATILLVEDERLVREVIRRSLERAGYRVIEAADGAEGLAMVAEHGHTLAAVVTDMMMPGVSGRAFAMSVSVSNPCLGIVCISGYTDAGRSDGPPLDTNHVFLQKPFSRDQILAAIASVERAPAEMQSQLTVRR